jgi:hypothetical protein
LNKRNVIIVTFLVVLGVILGAWINQPAEATGAEPNTTGACNTAPAVSLDGDQFAFEFLNSTGVEHVHGALDTATAVPSYIGFGSTNRTTQYPAFKQVDQTFFKSTDLSTLVSARVCVRTFVFDELSDGTTVVSERWRRVRLATNGRVTFTHPGQNPDGSFSELAGYQAVFTVK